MNDVIRTSEAMSVRDLTDVVAAERERLYTRIERLESSLREIATRQPTRSAKASMRGLVVQLQSLAVSALGESLTLGIDEYDKQK